MFDKVTKSIRVLSASSVEKANSGHPGMPLGMADVGTVLFKNFLKISNRNPNWINRDRFVLSAGHGSALLYSLLHFNGFNISVDDMKNFRQLNSKTAGHPELDVDIGIDITTGPLGQGFATGVGLALAETYLSDIFGNEIIDHYVYGIVSDGDLMEGVSFEAAELAGLWKLGKLIYIFDDNNISIDGNVEKVSVTDQSAKFQSLGWHVQEIDGHDENQIINAVKDARDNTSKPSLIIAKSTIGKHSPNKQNTSGVHGSPLGSDEMEQFLENLDWTRDAFDHSQEIYDYFNEKRDMDNDKHDEWVSLLEEKIKTNDDFAILWNEFNNKKIEFSHSQKYDRKATRVTGSEVLKSIGESNRFILGGSADLAASTKQIISNSIYSHQNRSGQSIEFGIREHAMAAVVNGITLHSNLISYGSTFLVFSDYMRPSIRLASLMNLNSVYIFTHDSIYLGEDGPTHQPVEHLMSLRLIPGVDVIRPANSIEVQYAYQYIFTKSNNPKSLVLTRQSLDYVETNLSYKNFQEGAYELIKGDDITIFASGSEVSLAIEVSKKLKNKSVQIISTPILNQVNTDTLTNLKINEFVFTLELGRSIGWQDYIGKVTESFSIETFGKSAPQEDLTNYFEFSAEKIAEKILQHIS